MLKKVFLFVIVCLLVCCIGSATALSIRALTAFLENQARNQKYGIAYNAERKKIGLPIIPNDWVYHKSEWTNPKSSDLFKNRIPYHESKSITDRDGLLIDEEDFYYGSQDYNEVGNFGVGRDQLTIKYCYQVNHQDGNCFAKSGWHILFLSHDRFTPFIISYDLNIDEAKKILSGWGLTYP